MKKIFLISIFVFLSATFAGLFFSISLSSESSNYLGGLLLMAITDSKAGVVEAILSSLLANLPLIMIMLTSLLSRHLAPLPIIILACKGFAVGFCSGLIYINSPDNAFMISLLKLVPQNLLFIPAFICLCTFTFYCSIEKGHPVGRSRVSALSATTDKRLVMSIFVMIFIACIVEGVFIQIPI